MIPLLLAALAVVALPPSLRRTDRRSRSVTIPTWVRGALGAAAAGVLLGLPAWVVTLATVAAAWMARRRAGGTAAPTSEEMRRLASALDLIAACLDAGLTPAAALTACGDQPGLPERLATALSQAGAILTMGGDGVTASRPLDEVPQLEMLAAGLRRTSRGGVRLAEVARDLAARLRVDCRSADEASAARAGVLMTAPLAVCFLPAFLCLGLAPVVIGLISSVTIW